MEQAPPLIGVIDLASGRSVRAEGGARETYRPTKRFRFEDGSMSVIDGDACKLMSYYRAAGLGSIYLADLDALTNGRLQKATIERLLEHHDASHDFLLDAGIDLIADKELQWLIELTTDYDQLKLIIATECATGVDTYVRLVDQVGRHRLWISFDYRNQRWLSTQTTEQDWIELCRTLPPSAAIALDLGDVGKRAVDDQAVNPTGLSTTCEWTRQKRESIARDVSLVSGGGVRSWADAQRRLAAGAERLLVASWFTAGE